MELQAETGMTFIHPYDDELVIAGQGTIGLEILDQLPDVDAVIVPVGGGGLISGVAFAIKSLKPDVKVYGCLLYTSLSVLLRTTSQSRIRSTAVPLSALACHLPRPGESFLPGEPLAKRFRFR